MQMFMDVDMTDVDVLFLLCGILCVCACMHLCTLFRVCVNVQMSEKTEMCLCTFFGACRRFENQTTKM